jgi:cell division transport system permease protein
MTVAMILTTAISIGLFGGGLLVMRVADQSRDIYLDRVESQVFLTNDVSANDPVVTRSVQGAARPDRRPRRRALGALPEPADAYEDAIKKIPAFKDVASKDAFPPRSSSSWRTRNSTRTSTPRCRASRTCSTCSTRRS